MSAQLPHRADVTERPIIFRGPMVRAILDGAKTQTRRVVRPQPVVVPAEGIVKEALILPRGPQVQKLGDRPLPYGVNLHGNEATLCPYGEPGDRLWVRETWCYAGEEATRALITYRADWKAYDLGQRWCSPIFMPRWASRLTLEVTAVRVERVQAITEEDARAEGAPDRAAFAEAWDALNAKRGHGWDVNCFVWVLTFKRV